MTRCEPGREIKRQESRDEDDRSCCSRSLGGWMVTVARRRYFIIIITIKLHATERVRSEGNAKIKISVDRRHAMTSGESTGGGACRVSVTFEEGITRSCDCWRSTSAAGRLRFPLNMRKRSSSRGTRSLTSPGELLSPHDSSLSSGTHTAARVRY